MAEDPQKKRERQRRYDATEKGRARCQRGNAKRIRIGNIYVGRERQFSEPREVVLSVVCREVDSFKAKQSAEREALK